MKKLFGKKEKKDRPSSASDSTLKVPQSPGRLFSSTERISSTSHTAYTTSTKIIRTVENITINGTFPRQSYKPVYERTKEWSQKFDRGSPMRHSTSPSAFNFNPQPSQRKLSVPSPSYVPSIALYSRSPLSPLTTTAASTDARTFQVPNNVGAVQRRPVKSYDLKNSLTIKVKKCATPKNDLEERIPTYKTNSKGKRGSLLVINNIKFGKHEKERKGAEKDTRNIEELFRQMNFDRSIKTNLKKAEMKQELNNYAGKNFRQYDMNVIVMMSHGCGDAGSNSTLISGTDGQNLPTSDIIAYFTNSNCPTLAGKPKIFIFQCCRGSQEHVYTDAKDSLSISREGDMLLAYATIPGFVSYRQEYIGSWYIQAICKVFMDNAHNTHVEDMLRMVDEALAIQAGTCGRGQTSSYENRGFKCCYFNPM